MHHCHDIRLIVDVCFGRLQAADYSRINRAKLESWQSSSQPSSSSRCSSWPRLRLTTPHSNSRLATRRRRRRIVHCTRRLVWCCRTSRNKPLTMATITRTARRAEGWRHGDVPLVGMACPTAPRAWITSANKSFPHAATPLGLATKSPIASSSTRITHSDRGHLWSCCSSGYRTTYLFE